MHMHNLETRLDAYGTKLILEAYETLMKKVGMLRVYIYIHTQSFLFILKDIRVTWLYKHRVFI
jgi:hypothetical protein